MLTRCKLNYTFDLLDVKQCPLLDFVHELYLIIFNVQNIVKPTRFLAQDFNLHIHPIPIHDVHAHVHDHVHVRDILAI